MGKFLGAFLCVLTIGASSAHAVDQRLVGRWYGLELAPGEAHCWISERKSDGSYRTDFITQDGQDFNSYYQQGTWSATDQSFATIIQSESGTPVPPNRIEYTIVRVGPRELVYRHQGSGSEFTVKKVNASFRLPAKCGKSGA